MKTMVPTNLMGSPLIIITILSLSTNHAAPSITPLSSHRCHRSSAAAFVSPPLDQHQQSPCKRIRSSSTTPTLFSLSNGGQKIVPSLDRPRLHKLASAIQPIDQLADDDLVALPFDGYMASTKTAAASKHNNDDDDADTESPSINPLQLRLCVIRNQEYTVPLIRHEDDVETDLFLDPRCLDKQYSWADVVDFWSAQQLEAKNNDDTTTITDVPYYGVGWYGQRPVPSLGGGPGYGAEADEVWSIEEDVLEGMMEEGEVEIPVIDVGMAHGEKARGGALF